MNNMVVVGGGTAGWISAIYAKKSFPDSNITVIESQDIGILGAGEGSTPQLIQILDFLEIPVSSLVEKTNATIKNGIKFTNWSNNNNYYYHGFNIINNSMSPYLTANTAGLYGFPDVPMSTIISIAEQHNLLDYDFVANVSENNKVPFIPNSNIFNIFNPILDFSSQSNFSLHFDARLLADFLSSYGQSIGIKKIEGTVVSIKSKENGDIESILLDNQLTIDVDFVIDCTGFFRFFIGKHFNSEWKSFSDSLPMKKAIPFFPEINEESIPPYTEAIAMDYGWAWKIPLQNRYGAGYVFDSDYISTDDAVKEIYDKFNHQVTTDKVFNFDAGHYKKIWINNCLAVGLSSGFVEPLEATSIWQAIMVLRRFFINKNNIINRKQKNIDLFNNEYCKETQEIADFIYLHYVTNKTNNIFWSDFTLNNVMPESLKEKLFLMNESILENSNDLLFDSNSYYKVANGTGALSLENIIHTYNNNNLFLYSEIVKKQNNLNKLLESGTIDHSKFLQYLKGTMK